MRALDLFSGIGGFALSGHMVWGDEYEVVSFCEIDPFCRGILNRHWPGVLVHDDIKTFRGADYEGAIDIITGGDPCQPHSQAGKRNGKEDHRYLWPEMLRIIEEARPRWVINENVAGSISNGIVDQKCDDLERAGYTCQPFNIPALAVGAWHFRQRIWIVAHANNDATARQRGNSGEILPITESVRSNGGNWVAPNTASPRWAAEVSTSKTVLESGAQQQFRRCAGGIAANTNGARLALRESIGSDACEKQPAIIGGFWEDHWLEAATRFCTVVDGIPQRVVRRREKIKACGNAIVPQVAAVIMQAIKEVDVTLREAKG